MTHRTRLRVLIGAVALPVLLMLADALIWREAEQRLRIGFAAWSASQQSAGWTVTTGRMARAGWPLTATLKITDFVLSNGAMTWNAGHLRLSVGLAQPTSLVVAAGGEQTLRLGDLPAVVLTAERLQAVLPLQAGTAPQSFHVIAAGLRAAEGAGTLRVAGLDMQLEIRPAAGRGDAAVTCALRAQDIVLPALPDLRWPLGPDVASLDLAATVSGPLPGLVPVDQGITAWRDGGGTVQVQRLALRWGPLDLSSTATLSLDAQLQPMGAANSRITGQSAALDAMAASGVIKPQAALAAKAVLALIGTPASADAPASVDVPLTLQNRTLTMGRIPLVRLPPLAWQASGRAGMVAQ